MELSINQLADLKIAIEQNDKKLKNMLQDYAITEKHNISLKAQNETLAQEVKDLVEQRKKLIAENEKIREEKQTIFNEFSDKTSKLQREFKERKIKLEEREGIVQLRTLEVDKREKTLAGDLQKLTSKIEESRKIDESIGNKTMQMEAVISSIQKEREQVNLLIERKNKILEEIAEKEAELEKQKEAMKDKQNEMFETLQANQNAMIELAHKEKYISATMPKLENFGRLLKEVKTFVAQSQNKKAMAQVEEVEDEFLNNRININIELEHLSISELRDLLDSKGIAYNPNNYNKTSLIKLLNI